MKKNIGHLMECIKFIYIGRRKAQLASSRRHISFHNHMPSRNYASSYNGLSSHIRFFRNLRLASLSASAALIAIMTLAVFPIIRKASTAEATSLPSTTTLTMTTGSESADLSLLVNNASGTFSSSSNDELAKFSIATNNYTGYTLTISGSDDTGLLTNTDTTITTNNPLSSITSATDSSTFASSTALNGKWGYLPSKYSSVDNTSFRPAPTTTASTLNVTNCANDTTNCPDTEDDYTIGLGIRADYTKPAGIYTNTFILTATANPVGYSITYADNTGDSTVTNIPAIQSGVTSSTFVTLNPDKTPTRTGYTFKSWCLGDSTTDPTDPSTIVTNNGTICHGTEYTAGESADFVNQTIATSAVTLYAVWSPNSYEITYGIVANLTSVSLDGTNCTTLLSSGGCKKTLVNGQSYALTATANTGYSFSSWNAGSNGTIANTTSANTTYTVGAGTSTITPTITANKYSLTITFAGTGVSSVEVRTAAGTGGTLMGTVSSSGGSVSNLVYGTAYYLYPTYSANNYTLSTWAKTDTATNSALSSTTAANPTYTIGAGNGAVTITGRLVYIQDYTTAMCQTAASSASVVVRDIRDNQDYTVRYINGNCWMTRNLAIGCNGSGLSYGSGYSQKTLTSTDSNVSSSWNTPTTGNTAGYSYTTPYLTCSSTYGGYYNYAAASAGTITGSSNSNNGVYDVCPKNWRLFTKTEAESIINSAALFEPVSAGSYYNKGFYDGSNGYWPSSTVYNSTSHYRIVYTGNTNTIKVSSDYEGRMGGYSIRCIRSS